MNNSYFTLVQRKFFSLEFFFVGDFAPSLHDFSSYTSLSEGYVNLLICGSFMSSLIYIASYNVSNFCFRVSDFWFPI